jgi:protein-tyrosine phosphatase
VLSLASSDADRSKVSLILEASFPGENRQVPDPYYGGDQGFQVVYDLLTQASANWLSQWQN